jgi:serine-type D-Ala-D-Ala carboxypeptidase (penicillin-binding protein 5/6)
MIIQDHYRHLTFVKISALLAVAIAGSLFALAVVERPSAKPEKAVASVAAADVFAGINLEGKSAIVLDAASGKVLFEKNADAQLPLASLTKVALVLAVSEVLPIESMITIPYFVRGTGDSGHFDKGEVWQVRDVVDLTLVASSNGSADILAEVADAPLRERYAEAPEGSAALWRMNELAKNLGLARTYFLNVSGLDISSTQSGAYGSARDVATLFAYAASGDPSLFAGTAERNVFLTDAFGADAQRAENTNDAQGAIPGLIMGKTGLTDLAGGNLAVVFDVGLSHPVVAVVLGSSESGRFTDMQRLVERARRSVIGTL